MTHACGSRLQWERNVREGYGAIDSEEIREIGNAIMGRFVLKSIQIRRRGSTQGHPAPRSTEHVLLHQL